MGSTINLKKLPPTPKSYSLKECLYNVLTNVKRHAKNMVVHHSNFGFSMEPTTKSNQNLNLYKSIGLVTKEPTKSVKLQHHPKLK